MSHTKQEAIDALEVLSTFIQELPDDAGGEAAAETVKASVPSVEDATALKKADAVTLAGELGFDVSDNAPAVVKEAVVLLAKITADEDVTEEDDDDVNALATMLGLTPDKKVTKTVAAIKAWGEALGTAGEAAGEADAAAEPEAEPEADAAAEPDPAPATNAGAPDYDAIAAKVKKLPDDKTMKAQLLAFNAAAEDDDKITVGKDLKAAYRELLSRLVDGEGTVAAWEATYIRANAAGEGEGWCCGLPLADVPAKEVPKALKGKSVGKCTVSDKLFFLNDDGTGFEEHEG